MRRRMRMQAARTRTRSVAHKGKMFNVTFSLLLVALALNAESAFGTNQHLICKTVDDVFSVGTRSQGGIRPQTIQGPPGKTGPTGFKGEHGVPGLNGGQGLPGSKGEGGLQGSKGGRGLPGSKGERGLSGANGERGLPGSNGERGLPGSTGDRGLPGSIGGRGLPGLVDPQDIVNSVNEKMREVTRDFQERIESLEDILLCDGEGFYYRPKCYNVILHDNRDVTYANARELCTAKGGRPADILNAEHQSLVADYVRKKTSSIVEIWLGISYQTGTLRFSNGNEVTGDVAASFRWWSTFPSSESSYEAMMIAVNTNTYGFLNYSPTYKINGVLCEK